MLSVTVKSMFLATDPLLRRGFSTVDADATGVWVVERGVPDAAAPAAQSRRSECECLE